MAFAGCPNIERGLHHYLARAQGTQKENSCADGTKEECCVRRITKSYLVVYSKLSELKATKDVLAQVLELSYQAFSSQDFECSPGCPPSLSALTLLFRLLLSLFYFFANQPKQPGQPYLKSWPSTNIYVKGYIKRYTESKDDEYNKNR